MQETLDRSQLGITTNDRTCAAMVGPLLPLDVQPVQLRKGTCMDCGYQSGRTAAAFLLCEPSADRARTSASPWKGATRIATKGPVSRDDRND